MISRDVAILCLGLSAIVSPGFSQGICIPSALKTRGVQGYVLWKRDGRPMSEMSVELLSFDQGMNRIAEAKSGADGRFELKPPSAGKFWLRVKNEQIPGLTVEIRVERKEPSAKDRKDYIHFLLDLDPQKYCWGSSVSVAHSEPNNAGPKSSR